MEKRKKLKQLGQSEDGSAIIIVMCVMVVFVALSFAILLSASVLLSDVQKTFAEQQLEIAASSFKQQFEKELLENPASETDIEDQTIDSIGEYLLSELDRVVREPAIQDSNPFIWHSDTGERNFSATFTTIPQSGGASADQTEQIGKEAGTMLIQMVWTYDEEDKSKISKENRGELTGPDLEDVLKEEMRQFKNRGVTLDIVFTAEKQGRKVQLKGTYALNVGLDENQLVWNWGTTEY